VSVNAATPRTDQAFIYALSDPRDGRVRYVGKTIDVGQRLADHMQPSHSVARAFGTSGAYVNQIVHGLYRLAAGGPIREFAAGHVAQPAQV
jgi:hypothetical protein